MGKFNLYAFFWLIWAPALASSNQWTEQRLPGFEEEVLVLVVDKAKLTAELKTWPENPRHAKTLAAFRVAIGKETGDKRMRGDNRTPEGIYMATGVIPGHRLPARYGATAIPINFPNPMDRFFQKTGSGIWLHGVEDNKRIAEARVTEGCVAFYNEDIEKLTRWMVPNQGVVMITSDGQQVNRPEEIDALRLATEEWLDAWQARQLDRYIAYYSDAFRYKGKTKTAYLRHKRRIFRSYEEMSLASSDLRIFSHDRYAMAVMNQDFNGDDRYISKGRKILYWQKQDQSWKIVREVFEERRLMPVTYNVEEFSKVALNSALPPSSPTAEDRNKTSL